MAQSLLARLLDGGRAGVQRLGGRAGVQRLGARAAPASAAAPAPARPGGAAPLPTADGSHASEDRPERAVSQKELAALRLSLVAELDRLALREGSTAAGPRR